MTLLNDNIQHDAHDELDICRASLFSSDLGVAKITAQDVDATCLKIMTTALTIKPGHPTVAARKISWLIA